MSPRSGTERVYDDNLGKGSFSRTIGMVVFLSLAAESGAWAEDRKGPDFVELEEQLLKRARPKLKDATSIKIKKLNVVTSDVRIGELSSSLPSKMASDVRVLENRTSNEQMMDVSLSISTTEEETFTFTRGVKLNNELSVGIKYQVLDIGAKRSWELKIDSGEVKRFSGNKTYVEKFTQRIGPNKALAVTITREIINAIYKLEGTITFDGVIERTRTVKDVYACGNFGMDRCSRNKTTSSDVKISDILSLKDRTFSLSGEASISSSTNTRTTTNFTETNLK